MRNLIAILFMVLVIISLKSKKLHKNETINIDSSYKLTKADAG